jgi:hypothetical protein
MLTVTEINTLKLILTRTEIDISNFNITGHHCKEICKPKQQENICNFKIIKG